MFFARSQRQGELPRRVVRAAGVADLARPDQVVEGAQGLVDRSLRVGEMGLVKVDVIGTKPSQAGLAGGQDVPSREPLVVGTVADPDPALGGDDEPIASTPRRGQPAADDLLGPAGRSRDQEESDTRRPCR